MSLFPALLSASSRRRSDGSTAVAFDTSLLTFSAARDIAGATPFDSFNTFINVTNASDLLVMIVFAEFSHTKNIDGGQNLYGESGGVARFSGRSLYDFNSLSITTPGTVASGRAAFAPGASNQLWGIPQFNAPEGNRISGSVVVSKICGWAFDRTLVGSSAGPTASGSTFFADFTDQAIDAVSFKYQPATTVLYDFTAVEPASG
jgi:hypothetical protein